MTTFLSCRPSISPVDSDLALPKLSTFHAGTDKLTGAHERRSPTTYRHRARPAAPIFFPIAYKEIQTIPTILLFLQQPHSRWLRFGHLGSNLSSNLGTRVSHAIIPTALQLPTSSYFSRSTLLLASPICNISLPSHASYDFIYIGVAISRHTNRQSWLPRLMGEVFRWRTRGSASSWWACPPEAKATLHKRVNTAPSFLEFPST